MNRTSYARSAQHWERPLGGMRSLWNEHASWILLTLAMTCMAMLAQAQISITPMGTYATGQYDMAAAEIADFDPVNDRIWFSNAQNSIIGLNASNPASLSVFLTIPIGVYGGGVNSVVVLSSGIAVAVEASPKTDPGKVVFFDLNGNFLNQVTVGALPDMITVTPDGTKLITANEGEPDNNYLIDPLGTVSIIDITGGLASVTNANVTTLDFSAYTPAMLPGVRIFGPGASVAQDMEPEYVAVSDDSQWAFVTCQENNAVAKINLTTSTITQVTALGYKDHSLAGNGLDASDSPASLNIANWPVRGLYMPDAAHAFTVGGQTYVLYANEGDVREWTGTPGYAEALRVSNAAVVLDPTIFPNAATLKQNANLGRLNISKASGDTDNDGDYDALYAFGGRSFSIRDANGTLIYDSGDDLEQLTATAYPANFNASNTNNTFDNRSDDKGPEPEAATTGVINGQTYAFVGLERIGGVMIFNVSNPFAPVFVQYLNNRNFGAATNTPAALDLGVESITFVSAADSPNGIPMLITSNESSGTVSTFQILGCTVGASCDDANPATVNDVYNASCQCVGTAPTFAAGNVVVLQAGDGASALANTGNPVVLREFTPTGTPGNTVTVPSTGGSAMIISGSATSEGNMSLSADGTELIFTGYAQALPNATALAASSSATINRAVGSVNASGTFTRDFTSSTFFSANNPRGAASDGTNFWGSGANGGVNYWGPGTAATIATGKTNLRSAAVFNGQLYVSSASASGTPAVTGVFAVGSGLPTGTGQSLSTIAATGSTNTNGFYLSPAGTTLYVTIGTGGIQKWVNTGSWALAYTLTFADGANSVVADFSGANPIIYAVSNTGASLLKIIDPNSGSGSVPVTPLVIATAPVNTAFRGISFAPCTPSTWYADTDGDGFGDPNSTSSACSAPSGFVANNTDLCPADGTKQAPGVCGCGAPDVAATHYADVDGDGFGDPASPLAGFTCIVPAGFVANNTDNCPAVAGIIGSICDDGNPLTLGDVLNASCTCAGVLQTAFTGCSSSQSPYVKPLGAGNTTTSILTVGDLIGGYDMVGIPDGMGAYDNNDGTFTLLVDHELGNTVGVVRDHGFIGSFVSKWVINKSTLCVQSGDDLIQNVLDWNGTAFVPATVAIGRLCSADLPAVSAFYNAGSGKGTQSRIFLSGEEVGNEGRAYGHIATGASAGTSYQLPHLGRFSWENAVANPTASDKTIVVGLDDTTPGQVYVYVGTKQSTGNEIEKAGLFGGKLYGIKVNGIAVETAALFPATSTPFSLFDLGLVQNTTGAALQATSVANGVTEFLRPEDGQWDPTNPNVFYFVTTAAFTGANATASRLYKATFTDILNPELGGTIEAVLDGTEGQKMMDNLTVDQRGNVYIQEDVGNQAHIGKIWQYDIATDVLTQVAYHDSARFITGAPLFLTQDEESSGIIDMQDILGKGRYLLNVQAHYGIAGELVEGGQLLEFATGDTIAPCVPALITAITPAQTICSLDQLALNAAASGTLPLTYAWSGTGTFAFGSTSPSAIVNGAATGSYTLTVTNACGSDNDAVAVTVNPAVVYYADVDGDGFGDPAVDSLACTQPAGYVANNTDNCPAVVGVIGSTCDDGNASTGGDVINASCVCEGLPVDCEGVPAGPAQPGTACNDGNPNTVLDTYNASCNCVGVACSASLKLAFTKDATSDVTWYIHQQGSGAVVQTGSLIIGASTQDVTTCVPDGCYYLRVTDNAGDGIGGGYILSVLSSGSRIIDNRNNFLSGTTSQIASNLGFCLPLSADRLISTSCDKMDWRANEYVVATDNPTVTAVWNSFGAGTTQRANSGYEMWWYNPNGGYTFRRFQSHATANGLTANAIRACHFKINSWSGNQLLNGVVYNVRVRARLYNVAVSETQWGAACRFGRDEVRAQCPLTKLMDIAGSPQFSCGASRAIGTGAANLVHARPVVRYVAGVSTAANRYKFRFVTDAGGTTIIKISATGQSWVNTAGLAVCKVYDVDVTASYDNGVTYCEAFGGTAFGQPYAPKWGEVCTLTTLGCPSGNGGNQNMDASTNHGSTSSPRQVSMYPNPNRGDQVMLSLDAVEEGVNTVSVDIYDVFGKRVDARTIAVQDNFLNTTIDLNGALAAGMYTVNITAGATTYAERLLIQP